MRRRSGWRPCAVVALTLLAGCGGGGGGTGGGGGPITPAQRGVILAAAGAKYDSLANLAPAEANQQMAAYLKQQPQFEAAGVSDDGCAWGRFTDGRLAIFVNNREPLPNRSMPRTAAVRNRSAELPSNLPKSTEMNMACVLGASYDGGTTLQMAGWMHDAGYQVWGGCNVGPLKSETKSGLFYISTHGGSGEWRDKSSAYAIWTAEDWSDGTEVAYQEMLDNRELCFMYATEDFDAANKAKNEWHWAITARFVMSYMKFPQDSLVFIDACSSENGVFKAACMAKGASVYAGWTAPVMSNKAVIAATHLIDRLAGTNAQDPESPKQRPFDWKSVFAWMQEKGYDVGSDKTACRLQMTRNPDDSSPFGLFVPSIAFMWAHEYEEKLYIWGIFGDNPGADGQVTVGGSPVQVQEWAYDAEKKMDRIICKLPYEGAGSAGDVKVKVRKAESDARQLSRYQGSFKLTHDTGKGPKYTVTAKLRFRVDLQSLRMKPGEGPKLTPMNPQRIFSDKETEAEFEASGFFANDQGSVTWSGHDTLPCNVDGSGSNSGFIASIQFDPDQRTGHLTLNGTFDRGMVITVRDKQGQMQTANVTVTFGMDEMAGKDDDYPMPYAEVTLGSDWSIQKGKATATRVQPVGSSPSSTSDTVTLEWDQISCEYPPKEDTKRSARR